MIFVSYSNKEYAFAESLVRTLAASEHNFKLWFAPGALDEGHDWFTEITAAASNDECDSLILVASQAALNSIWVAYEWKTILDLQKPIYIVLFEPVHTDPITVNIDYTAEDVESDDHPLYQVIKRLDPSFSPAPNMKPDETYHISITLPIDQLFAHASAIIDCRQSFDQNIERLMDALVSDEVEYMDVVPMPNRLGIPVKTTLQVRLILLSLFLPGAMCMLIGALSGFVHLIIQDQGGIFLTFLMTIFGFGLFNYGWHFMRREPLNIEAIPHFRLRHYLIPAIFMVPVLGYLAYRAAVRPADNVYRWLPRDAVLPFQRNTSKNNQLLSLDVFHANFPEKNYQLVYASEDRRVGHRVRETLANLGYTEMPDDATDFGFYVVILSNKTAIEDVLKINASGKKVFAVLASSVNLPRHADQVVRYQWIDYRTHPHDLQKFIASKDPVVPVPITTLHVPKFKNLLNAMLLNGTFLVAAGISVMFYPSIIDETEIECLWCEVVFPVLAGVIYLWLVSRILQRKVAAETYFILIVIAWIFGALLPLSAGNILDGSGAGAGGWSEILFVYYIFVFPLMVLYYARRMSRWLPAWTWNRQRSQTVAVPYSGQIWRISMVFVFMTTLIFLCRLSNLS